MLFVGALHIIEIYKILVKYQDTIQIFNDSSMVREKSGKMKKNQVSG